MVAPCLRGVGFEPYDESVSIARRGSSLAGRQGGGGRKRIRYVARDAECGCDVRSGWAGACGEDCEAGNGHPSERPCEDRAHGWPCPVSHDAPPYLRSNAILDAPHDEALGEDGVTSVAKSTTGPHCHAIVAFVKNGSSGVYREVKPLRGGRAHTTRASPHRARAARARRHRTTPSWGRPRPRAAFHRRAPRVLRGRSGRCAHAPAR